MEKKIAQIISGVASPVLLLGISTGLVMWQGNLADLLSWAILLAAGLMPLGSVLGWLYLSGEIKTLNPPRERRPTLFLVSTIGFVIGSTVLFALAEESLFSWTSLGVILAVFFGLLFIVNTLVDKASVHISGFIVSLVIMGWYVETRLLLFLSLVTFVAWARIKLHSHTWNEILLGTGIGTIISILIVVGV